MLVLKRDEDYKVERGLALALLRRRKNYKGWEKEPAYVNELITGSDSHFGDRISVDINTFGLNHNKGVCVTGKLREPFIYMTPDEIEDFFRTVLENIIQNELTSFIGVSKKSANDMDLYSVNELEKRVALCDGYELTTRLSNTIFMKVCDITLSVNDTPAIKFSYDMKNGIFSDISVVANEVHAHLLVEYSNIL